VRADAAESRG